MCTCRKSWPEQATADDEKMQIGIKISLENLDCQVVDVHEDVKSIEGKVDAMQQCVVTIIPDYQKENLSLKSQQAHKTKECDRIEGQKAHQTRIINMEDGKIDILESRVKNLEEKEAIWNRERAAKLIHPSRRVGTGSGYSRPAGGRWSAKTSDTSGRCARTRLPPPAGRATTPRGAPERASRPKCLPNGLVLSSCCTCARSVPAAGTQRQ